ncbi:hypothetical protein JZO81_18990 [Enterococcus hulanensis]|uniref:hypothetical protein n=1 Tax=Enterococcus TaxID=1350 RepID=UPI000B5A72DD|nr:MULTISPECIES: hypothetical protein [Enterococcus]MBO0413145.1 hypothetical protein [Enterococcus hulanensis]OTO15231.1 hypothetical protein A5875_004389 [Enterococcus sp. 3H8_DIV0648]
MAYIVFKQPVALKSDKSYTAVVVGINFSTSVFVYIFSAQGNDVATLYVIKRLDTLEATEEFIHTNTEIIQCKSSINHSLN